MGEGRGATDGHEMNDVEAVEQAIRKSAGGNPIEKRDRGPRDEADGVTGPARELGLPTGDLSTLEGSA